MPEAEKPVVRRLFFALWPDEALRTEIGRATRTAVRRAGGKPVESANYHVTLKFLGTVDAAGEAALAAAVGALQQTPFEFALDRLGYWPQPRILWLGAGERPAPLVALAQALENAAAAIGIEREWRPYRPHVSLARKVAKPGSLGSIEPIVWQAESFALVASDTEPGGAHYRVLHRWPLSAQL